MGASIRRATASPLSMPGTSMRRYAGTRSALPFSSRGSTASTSMKSFTSTYVGAPTRISIAGAACSSRAAVFTASPVTRRCPAETSPATTSPVLTPVRFSRRTPHRASSRSFTPARACFMSHAALTARKASSSWILGRPNTAMIASPMYFSTVPPWDSSTTFISLKYTFRTSRSDSLSSCSPRVVEPLRSQKTMETVLRTSAVFVSGTSCVPQNPHSRKRSGFSSPQLGQICMGGV